MRQGGTCTWSAELQKLQTPGKRSGRTRAAAGAAQSGSGCYSVGAVRGEGGAVSESSDECGAAGHQPACVLPFFNLLSSAAIPAASLCLLRLLQDTAEWWRHDAVSSVEEKIGCWTALGKSISFLNCAHLVCLQAFMWRFFVHVREYRRQAKFQGRARPSCPFS